jgi:hypothetical protein
MPYAVPKAETHWPQLGMNNPQRTVMRRMYLGTEPVVEEPTGKYHDSQ